MHIACACWLHIYVWEIWRLTNGGNGLASNTNKYDNITYFNGLKYLGERAIGKSVASILVHALM